MGWGGGRVAALARSPMNSSISFERITKPKTETMRSIAKTITVAAMTTKRITSLRELLFYCGNQHLAVQRDVLFLETRNTRHK